MKKEPAKAMRARRVENSSPGAPVPPVSDRLPDRADFSEAHVGVGNAALAKQAVPFSPVAAQTDSLSLQSALGNAAVQQAALDGDAGRQGVTTVGSPLGPSPMFDPTKAQTPNALGADRSSLVLPADYMSSRATPAQPDTVPSPSAVMSPAADPLAARFATHAAPNPLTGLPFFIPSAAETATKLSGLTPDGKSVEDVSTIVFEEEQIIAGQPAEADEKAKKAPEEAEEESTAGEEKAKVEFSEDEAAQKAEKGAEEEKTALAAEAAKVEEATKGAEAKPEEVVDEAEKEVEAVAAEGEAEEAEAVAGEEMIEAGTEEVKEAGAADAAPAEKEGGGGAGPALATWKAKVSGATSAIKQPDMSGAAGAGERVRAAGGAATGKAAAAREGVTKEAEAVVPPPPKPPDPLPPPSEDPVPEASTLVRDASDKRLTNQTLPPLVPTPRGNVPKVPTALSSEHSTKVTTESALAAEAAKKDVAEAEAKEGKDPDKERLDKMEGAQGEKADGEGRTGAGEPLVLVDEGPPPPPTMTKTAQTDVGQVLAVLISDPQGVAKQIVDDARGAAYPDETLLFPTFNDLGDAVLPEIETSVAEQLDAVREQAGISKEHLDKHVTERKKKLEEEAGQATEDLGAAGEDETAALEKEGQDTSDAIAGARDAVDEKTDRQLEASAGDTDPVVIKSKRERLVRGVARKVAQQSLGYTQAGTRREKSLDDMGASMISAYTQAARTDEEQLLAAAKAAGKSDADAALEAEQQSAPSYTWVKEKIAEVRRQVGELKTAAKTEAGDLDTAVKAAGTSATDLIRLWGEAQLSEHQSFWEWLVDLFSDWSAQAHEEAAVWEEARTAETTAAVVSDLQAIDMVKQREAQGLDGSQLQHSTALTEEQRAVIKAYYEGGKDSIAAVAAGLRTRLSTQRRPELIKKFEPQLIALPPERADDVDLVAQAQKPGRTAYEIASDVHAAVDQWGTEESKIFSALNGLTPLKLAAVRKTYTANNWGDIDKAIASELSDEDLTRAEAQLKGDQSLADAAALREAIAGAGTDEQAIMQLLRGKSEAERKAIIEAYEREYGDDLKEDLESDLGGDDRDRADALLAGDTTRADAIALDQAMHGGLFGLGTDEKEIENTYTQIRTEVEAEAAQKGWTTAQMEAEVKRRNGAVETVYDAKAAAEGESTLRESFKEELSGADLDLAVALHDNDPLAADMARIEIEKQGLYASDDAVNNVLKSQGDRAKREVERDLNVDFAQRRELTQLRGKEWDEEKERAELNKQIKLQTDDRAKGYMSSLEKGFNEKYSKYGRGTLQKVIEYRMSGTDQEKAKALLNQGGILTPAQEIDFAIQGVGTDDDNVKSALAGKTAEEIEVIRQEWQKKHPDENFDERVLSEFSGRDRFDMKLKLLGEPQTPEQKLERAKMKLEYEQNAYLLGGAFSKDERKLMEREIGKLEADVKKINELKAKDKEPNKLTPAEKRELAQSEARYKLHSTNFERSVEDHRAAVDSVTDTAATIAGIVAMVVVTVVVSIATAGAGTAVLAAIAAGMTSASVAGTAAAAAAIATVVTKMAFKGSAYGAEEMGVDLAVGAADAVASAFTAGLGGKLLALGKLSQLAKSAKVMPRLFANAMAEGAEGFASSLPSALTGAVLDDKNWKGDPFSNIMGSAMIGVGMGTVLSGGMGMLGGLSKPAAKAAGQVGEAGEALAGQARKQVAGETPEMLAKRGSPLERVAGFESFQKANPGKSYDDFIAELDAGIPTHKADDIALQQMEKRLKDELYSAIPPGQRDQFNDVVVDVVSDAEFARLTRSAKGQAVVLIENGKPRVLLRESANPNVLREEGIHLLQSVDPKKAHLFKELDESVMKNWDQLPLDEQISLYNKKLDLEIDGQQRLLKNLDEALAAAGDDTAARKQILAQMEQAQHTLDNLSKRLDEVGDLTPQKRLDIADGKTAKPDYLDQPARLFSKQAEPPDPAKLRQEIVESIKKAGRADEAGRVLDKLRKLSGDDKGVSGIYKEVTDKVKALSSDPKLQKEYLEKINKVLKSRDKSAAELLPFIAASTKMPNPGPFLDAVTKFSSSGKGAGRVSREALDDVAKKVATITDPAVAAKYLDDLNSVLDSYHPKKPGDLSGFLSASTKAVDPTAYLAKVKGFTDHLKTNNIDFPEKSLRSIANSVANMDAEKGLKYIDALQDFSGAHPKGLADVSGFLSASRKATDPTAYLDSVKNLLAQKGTGGLSDKAIKTLSKKAGFGTLDLEWLVKTDLFKDKTQRQLFNFMAEDFGTPWKTFMDAALEPANDYLKIKARTAARAIAGEYITFLMGKHLDEVLELGQNAAAKKTMNALQEEGIEKIVGRQVPMGPKKRIDFAGQSPAGVHGIEVKTYSADVWKGSLDAWELKALNPYAVLTEAQADAFQRLTHMLEQLEAAFTHTGNPPILVTSDVINNLGPRGQILKEFMDAMPPGTAVKVMSEAEITRTSGVLRALFGIR